MTRILVEPEALQATGRSLRGTAGDIQGLGSRLLQAYRSVSWAAQAEAGVEHELAEAEAAAAALAEQLEALAAYLERKSQAFSAADSDGAQTIGGVGAAVGGAVVARSVGGTLGAIPWLVGKFPDLFGKKPPSDENVDPGSVQVPPAGNAHERYDSSNYCYAKEHPNFDALATGALNRKECEALLKARFPKYWRAMQPTLDAEGHEWLRNVAGNFDGQGASVGCLQWNFGQGTLQPLLRDLHDKHPDVWNKTFPDGHGDELWAHMNDLQWVKTHLNEGGHMNRQWASEFDMLCATREFQAVQVQHMESGYWGESLKRAQTWGFHSEKGVAAVFNATVQSGYFAETNRTVAAWEQQTGLHRSDFKSYDSFLDGCAGRIRDRSDVDKIKIFRDVYAAQADPRWSENVRERFTRILNDENLSDGPLE